MKALGIFEDVELVLKNMHLGKFFSHLTYKELTCEFLASMRYQIDVFWSILEHMGHKEHGGTWHMEAAQLDTQRKKGEAILKTSSTVHSTNRSSSSTRPAKLQLDRAGEVKVKPEKCCFPLDFPLTLNLILLYLKALSHEKTTKL
ncbi:unnamed protein product [Microthlaspi erraticum]|uniref:Arabidopsis retrotransposon Orf1 C-terminal domain-containing protein n=2 Tax=Microthlaspi erraticum TaxID=1685480 RepID=A0A6D2K0J7_9BRAS|nr:unnamed protein product [Microthlaspi erraticum]